MKLKDFDNFVNESVRDAMKPISTKNLVGVRNKVLDDTLKILDKIPNAIEVIRWVVQDYQLDIESDDYMGFLNMGVDLMDDEKMIQQLKDFVYLYNNGYSKFIDDLLAKVHLEVEGHHADEEEVVIFDTLRKK